MPESSDTLSDVGEVKRRGLPIAISMVALLLAVGHLLFPAAKIDAVMLALLAIAVLPWLGSISNPRASRGPQGSVPGIKTIGGKG